MCSLSNLQVLLALSFRPVVISRTAHSKDLALLLDVVAAESIAPCVDRAAACSNGDVVKFGNNMLGIEAPVTKVRYETGGYFTVVLILEELAKFMRNFFYFFRCTIIAENAVRMNGSLVIFCDSRSGLKFFNMCYLSFHRQNKIAIFAMSNFRHKCQKF